MSEAESGAGQPAPDSAAVAASAAAAAVPGPAAGRPAAGSASAATAAGPQPASSRAGRRYAAGVYGTIITGAILATSGPRRDAIPLTASIIFTLVVYWLAEQYSELLGEHLGGGRLPGWRQIRRGLARTWPMVAASLFPLLALDLARAFGASQQWSALAALIVAMIMLLVYGWLAGRASALRRGQQLLIALVTALLGVVMVVLKVLVLTHLH